MSKKQDGPKGPMPPHSEYLQIRRTELKEIGLTAKELKDLILEEWSLMDDTDKTPYIERFKVRRKDFVDNKGAIAAIGVHTFLSEIKQMRRKADCPPEFQEDEVFKNIKKMKRKKQQKGVQEIVINPKKKSKLCMN